AGVSGSSLRRSMGFSAGAGMNLGLRLHKTNDGGANNPCTVGSVRFVSRAGGTGSEGCVDLRSFRRLRISINKGTNTFRVFDLVRFGPAPFADADGARDVDMDDFSLFQTCITGPLPNAQNLLPPACICFDRDLDNDVDFSDLDAFRNCLTNPTVQWSTTLNPN